MRLIYQYEFDPTGTAVRRPKRDPAAGRPGRACGCGCGRGGGPRGGGGFARLARRRTRRSSLEMCEVRATELASRVYMPRLSETSQLFDSVSVYTSTFS